MPRDRMCVGPILSERYSLLQCVPRRVSQYRIHDETAIIEVGSIFCAPRCTAGSVRGSTWR